ncbi:MAG TPA: hypothetical protein VNM92_05135 [Thermoanaerobaculia bacterium]|nr:hypothetical protein [Thermoanaerobaculia bacterium]
MRILFTLLFCASLLPDLAASEAAVEIPVSVIESVPAPFFQYDAAIASDGENYLVVWADHRRGPHWSDIYGARVSADGTVLDPIGIPIGTARGLETIPAVSWSGSNYVVVWSSAEAPPYSNIAARRVGRDGTLLEAVPTVFPEVSRYPFFLTAGSSSGNVLVTNSNSVRSLIIDSDLNIVREANHGRVVAVASDGERFVVLALRTNPAPNINHADLYATLLDSHGRFLREELLSRRASGVKVASDGASYLVSFSELSPGGSTRTRIVGFDGEARLVRDLFELFSEVTSMTWTGSEYLLTLRSYFPLATQPLLALRVGRSGEPIDAEPFVLRQPMPWWKFALASAGGRALLVTQSGQTSSVPSDITATVVDGTRTGPTTTVSRSAPVQTDAVVASSRTQYAVAWIERRSDREVNLRGSIFDRSGKIVAENFIIAPTLTFRAALALGSDGESFIAVWSENGKIRSRRFAANGQLMLAEPVELGSGSSSAPAVAWNGSTFLVAWTRGLSSPHAVRLSADGTLLDHAPLLLARARSFYTGIMIASDGRDFLVVWNERDPPCNNICISSERLGIFGTRVHRDGAVLDPQSFEIDRARAVPALAFAGSEYLVAWNSSQGVYARRLFPDGRPRDLSGIPLAPGGTSAVTLTSAGNQFVAGISRAATDETEEVTGIGIRSTTSVPVIELLFRFVAPKLSSIISSELSTQLEPRLSAIGSSIVAVYSRPSVEAKGVKRAFLRPIRESHRRAARR